MLAALITAAFVTAAQASPILISSSGTTFESAAGIATGTESVVSEVGGNGPLSTLTYTFNAETADVHGNYDGTGTYTGPTGTSNTLRFSFVLDPNDTVATTDSSSQSLPGTVTFTGGTGTYLGATGTGTISLNYLLSLAAIESLPATIDSATVVSGTPTVVPEPTSFALVLAGGLLLQKRRRSSPGSR